MGTDNKPNLLIASTGSVNVAQSAYAKQDVTLVNVNTAASTIFPQCTTASSCTIPAGNLWTCIALDQISGTLDSLSAAVNNSALLYGALVGQGSSDAIAHHAGVNYRTGVRQTAAVTISSTAGTENLLQTFGAKTANNGSPTPVVFLGF
jgi:hypothetical protein